MEKSSENITIVVNGKFHAFDYAAELHKQGRLKKIISTYPYFTAKKYGLTREVYTGLFIFEVIKRLYYRLFKKHLPEVFYAKLFTKTVLLFIPKDTKVLISFAGYSLDLFTSKMLNDTFKVLDRGSTHTLSNIILNKWAAEFHKSNWKPNSSEFIQRELEEYKMANLIMVPSNFVKNTFIENGVEENKVTVLPYGISNYKFTDTNKNVNYHRKDAVLFVGQFSPRKGIGVLIKAMQIVRKSNPNTQLWLVGGNTGLVDESIINEDWILNMGILKGEKLLSVYKSATVFCLPSFEEGLSLVITEAISCGLPVVTTPNSGGIEIIQNGKNGLIVPVGDYDKTAEAIMHILINRSQFEFEGSNNLTKNSWSNYVENLLIKINE